MLFRLWTNNESTTIFSNLFIRGDTFQVRTYIWVFPRMRQTFSERIIICTLIQDKYRYKTIWIQPPTPLYQFAFIRLMHTPYRVHTRTCTYLNTDTIVSNGRILSRMFLLETFEHLFFFIFYFVFSKSNRNSH